MRVRLMADQVRKLMTALASAGRREIGGQLFGEQLGPSDFRVTEVTIQVRLGTIARFVVDLLQAMRDAGNFFERTEHRYLKFNYIGEWHSHPSFEVQPSRTDIDTMRNIVYDSEFRGTFAILMIVRLDGNTLATGAWVFGPHNNTEQPILLEINYV